MGLSFYPDQDGGWARCCWTVSVSPPRPDSASFSGWFPCRHYFFLFFCLSCLRSCRAVVDYFSPRRVSCFPFTFTLSLIGVFCCYALGACGCLCATERTDACWFHELFCPVQFIIPLPLPLPSRVRRRDPRVRVRISGKGGGGGGGCLVRLRPRASKQKQT